MSDVTRGSNEELVIVIVLKFVSAELADDAELVTVLV